MAILNIFKKKEKPKEVLKSIPPSKSKKVSEIAYRVLRSPHVTEKASELSQKNQYVFRVYSGVNKLEIKKTIEDLYGVDVLAVKVVNIPRKARRLGKNRGWRKAYKKAIVKIKEGQKIELLPR